MISVLIAMESSGIVREAFRSRGFDAWSCDLQPADDDSPYHYQRDCFEVIPLRPWPLMIAHPDCTYLTSSGLHWNKRRPGRANLTERALETVCRLMDADIPRIAIENPQGCISTRIRAADQYIQPNQFGDNASKRTGLWLKNLPVLAIDPAKQVPPRMVYDMTDLTTELYRCLQKHCRHIGPAMKSYTTQSHGENATETVYELECQKCGGNQLSETSGAVDFAAVDRVTDELQEAARIARGAR